MSIVNQLSSRRGVKSDVPNQKLAKELASNNATEAIKEIAENLESHDKSLQSDCIKVLYEIGYINANLIADYFSDFLKLLKSKNNRLIWGGMIALSTLAHLKARELFDAREIIKNSIKEGSVITGDAGIKTLARVAASNKQYNNTLFPYLVDQLKNCRPKSVAQYAESIFEAVGDENKNQYINVLKERKALLNPSQSKRIEKLLKQTVQKD